MTLAVWPCDPARLLARALTECDVAEHAVEVPSFGTVKALVDGSVDLALVPTLEVLREPKAFELAPAGLVGEAAPTLVLAVRAPLNEVESVAFDPRYKQEALLAQLVFREHYQSRPSFRPVTPDASPADALERHDAALVPADAKVPEGAVRLDLGRDWTDLTLRPMVWGLLAARPGTLSSKQAEAIRDAAKGVDPNTASARVRTYGGGHRVAFQLTLDGYAVAGLDEWLQHLFYTGTLTDFPELHFVQPADEQDAAAAPRSDDSRSDDSRSDDSRSDDSRPGTSAPRE